MRRKRQQQTTSSFNGRHSLVQTAIVAFFLLSPVTAVDVPPAPNTPMMASSAPPIPMTPVATNAPPVVVPNAVSPAPAPSSVEDKVCRIAKAMTNCNYGTKALKRLKDTSGSWERASATSNAPICILYVPQFNLIKCDDPDSVTPKVVCSTSYVDCSSVLWGIPLISTSSASSEEEAPLERGIPISSGGDTEMTSSTNSKGGTPSGNDPASLPDSSQHVQDTGVASEEEKKNLSNILPIWSIVTIAVVGSLLVAFGATVYIRKRRDDTTEWAAMATPTMRHKKIRRALVKQISSTQRAPPDLDIVLPPPSPTSPISPAASSIMDMTESEREYQLHCLDSYVPSLPTGVMIEMEQYLIPRSSAALESIYDADEMESGTLHNSRSGYPAPPPSHSSHSKKRGTHRPPSGPSPLKMDREALEEWKKKYYVEL